MKSKKKQIKELEEKLYKAQKSAVFWETLYNTEKQRTWLDKLLGL